MRAGWQSGAGGGLENRAIGAEVWRTDNPKGWFYIVNAAGDAADARTCWRGWRDAQEAAMIAAEHDAAQPDAYWKAAMKPKPKPLGSAGRREGKAALAAELVRLALATGTTVQLLSPDPAGGIHICTVTPFRQRAKPAITNPA